MAICQCFERCCNRRKYEVIDSARSSSERHLVQVRSGVTLEVPIDFFTDSILEGSMFSVKALCLPHENIAVKWVHQSHDCGFAKHIETLQHAADRTTSIIESFMRRIDTKGWDIIVVKPLQASTENIEIGIEPFIERMEHFNSNSFWECNARKTYQRLIVALSHFSYAASKGEYVLTNLQGGVDEERKIVTLLTPSLVSERQAKFGCMDLGDVSGFFASHVCNSFCCDIPRRVGAGKFGFCVRV